MMLQTGFQAVNLSSKLARIITFSACFAGHNNSCD